MITRTLLASCFVVALSSPAFAEEKAKCTITKVMGNNVSILVDVSDKHPSVQHLFCKSVSNKPARDWIKANNACKSGVPKVYNVKFGKPGKEQTFELKLNC